MYLEKEKDMTSHTASRSRSACLLALIAFCGCDPVSKSAVRETTPSGGDGPVDTLRVWASSDGFKDEVLEGCRYWNVVGVRCILVTERLKADVRFEIRPVPEGLSTRCVKSARALADPDGTVDVDLNLFTGKDGLHRKTLVATIAHETGHELGMNHLPLSCEPLDPAKTKPDDDCSAYDPGPTALPDGTLVCGPGIMNAYRPEDFPALTRNDIRAFSIRDPAWRKTDPPRVK